MKIQLQLLIVVFVSAIVLYNPSSVLAQTQVGGQVGYDLDSSELFLGPNAVFNTPIQLGSKNIQINPEFSYYLVDDESAFSDYSSSFWLLAVDALYPVAIQFGEAYVGAGLILTHWSVSYDADFGGIFGKGSNAAAKFSNSDSNFGITGKVGSAFGKSPVRPFAEAGIVVSNDSWVFVQGGARYTL